MFPLVERKKHLKNRLKFSSFQQCLDIPADKLSERAVDEIDIAFDELTKHYKPEEDPKLFQSEKTKRGPLIEGWRNETPIMCSYKLVDASFEVWGFQTRVEDYIHRCIRDVLLLGHRQAFTWIDDWIDMSLDDVRAYERQLQEETNAKLLLKRSSSMFSTGEPATIESPTKPETTSNIGDIESCDSIDKNAPIADTLAETTQT